MRDASNVTPIFVTRPLLLNVLCPRGSIAQTHFKARLFQNLKTRLLYWGMVSLALDIMIRPVDQSAMFLPAQSTQEGEAGGPGISPGSVPHHLCPLQKVTESLAKAQLSYTEHRDKESIQLSDSLCGLHTTSYVKSVEYPKH